MSGLDTQTHTQYDYRNPRCACAPRVNNEDIHDHGYNQDIMYTASLCVRVFLLERANSPMNKLQHIYSTSFTHTQHDTHRATLSTRSL